MSGKGLETVDGLTFTAVERLTFLTMIMGGDVEAAKPGCRA
mgnify:CR=1 FL=1